MRSAALLFAILAAPAALLAQPDQLYEDPEVLEGLAARHIAFTRVPGEYAYPYECDASYGE